VVLLDTADLKLNSIQQFVGKSSVYT